MDRWESLVDQKIREAMEQGEFDDLAGKGAPIDLSENPFEDPDWRTAHRMLRNAGFAPAWIEERKYIDEELAAAQSTLARAWLILTNALGTEQQPGAEIRWERQFSSFRLQIGALNRRILAWNLKTPNVNFHRALIDIEKQLKEIQKQRPG